MRTTISVKDEILTDAKRQATQRNLSLSKFIERVLQEVISQSDIEEKSPPFKLITVTGKTASPEIDIDRTSALSVQDDIQILGKS
jgi:hypothetical protein